MRNVPGTSDESADDCLDFLFGELTTTVAAVNATLLLLWLLPPLLPPPPPADTTASSGSWDVHPESSASSVMSLQSPYPYVSENAVFNDIDTYTLKRAHWTRQQYDYKI